MTAPTQQLALCPDRWAHARLWAGAETTWRLTVEQKRAAWAHGCAWCGGHIPDTPVAPSPLLSQVDYHDRAAGRP